jgi:hypothetical protein
VNGKREDDLRLQLQHQAGLVLMGVERSERELQESAAGAA